MLRRPGRVCVNAKPFTRRDTADDAHDLHVAIGAQLDLENRVLLRFGDASLELLVLSDGDGKAGLRSLVGIQAPETIDRQSELLADEVVKRRADGAFSRRVSSQDTIQMCLGALERKPIGALQNRFELGSAEITGATDSP